MKRTWLLTLGYWLTAYALGLLIHPYKTVRQLVREKTFGPLVVMPSLFWVTAWLLTALLLILHSFLGLPSVWIVIKKLLVFLFWWVSIFLMLWQVLLIYLWQRFRVISSGE